MSTNFARPLIVFWPSSNIILKKFISYSDFVKMVVGSITVTLKCIDPFPNLQNLGVQPAFSRPALRNILSSLDQNLFGIYCIAMVRWRDKFCFGNLYNGIWCD